MQCTIAQTRQVLELREQIESLQAKLDALSGRTASEVLKGKTKATKAKRRTMSPKARAKIGAAQKTRRAKTKD